MPKVILKIGESTKNQHIYDLSDEKISYLLKFLNSITVEIEKNANFIKDIETGLKEVKKIRNGELPRKTLKQLLNGK